MKFTQFTKTSTNQSWELHIELRDYTSALPLMVGSSSTFTTITTISVRTVDLHNVDRITAILKPYDIIGLSTLVFVFFLHDKCAVNELFGMELCLC